MKTRILSAIILIALFVPLLLIGGEIFAIFMGIVSVCALHEIIAIRESKGESKGFWSRRAPAMEDSKVSQRLSTISTPSP